MKHLMMGFAACVLMMTSCTQQEITESVTDGQGQLNFSTGIGKQTTRAAEKMNLTLKDKATDKDNGIVLRTYHAPEGAFKKWFFDDLSYDQAKKEWKIESTRFRNTAATKYITYFPRTYVAEVDGTFDAADFNATFPEFTCTIEKTSDAQEDLIAGITEVGANKTDIVLGMRHILSQVNFGTVGYNGANISIRNIVIKGLHNSGTFKYRGKDEYPIGDWNDLGKDGVANNRNASYNYYNYTNTVATDNPQPTVTEDAVKGDVYIFGDGGNAGPGRKATTWYPTKEDVDRWENAPATGAINLANSLMLMPQSFINKADAKVTFEYQITDVDGAYVAGGSNIWEKGEFKLDFSTGSKEGEHYMAEWKQNYRYVYLIDFTDFLDGVALTFDVNVEMYPWENYDGDEGIVNIMAVGRPSAANMNDIDGTVPWYIASQSEKDPTSFTPHYKWAQVMKDEIWDLSTYDFTKIAKDKTVALNFKNVIFNTPDAPKTPTTITMTLPDGFSATPTTTTIITVEAHTTLPNTWVIKGGDKSPNAVVTITNDNYYRNSATLKAGIEAVGVTNGTKFGYGGTEAIDLTEMEPTATLSEGNTITVKFNCLVVPTVGATASGHWAWDAAKQTATWTKVEWKDLADAIVAFKGATANQIIYCSDATEIDLSAEFGEPTDPTNTSVIVVVFNAAAARTVQDTAGGKWSYNATTLTATWTKD